MLQPGGGCEKLSELARLLGHDSIEDFLLQRVVSRVYYVVRKCTGIAESSEQSVHQALNLLSSPFVALQKLARFPSVDDFPLFTHGMSVDGAGGLSATPPAAACTEFAVVVCRKRLLQLLDSGIFVGQTSPAPAPPSTRPAHVLAYQWPLGATSSGPVAAASSCGVPLSAIRELRTSIRSL